MTPIKLAIADSHKIYRKGLIATICNTGHINAIVEAENCQELIEKIKLNEPDVILLNINIQDQKAIESIHLIRSASPRVRILAMALQEEESSVISILKAGANGYLLKNAEPDEIVKAIERLMKNCYYFNDHISGIMLKALVEHKYITASRPLNAGLSKSEINVLRLICQQFTNHQIAGKLNMGVRTVDGHRNRILNKTGAKNTAGLVIFAVKNGFAEI